MAKLQSAIKFDPSEGGSSPSSGEHRSPNNTNRKSQQGAMVLRKRYQLHSERQSRLKSVSGLTGENRTQHRERMFLEVPSGKNREPAASEPNRSVDTKVLFVCVKNASRSPMAEALLKMSAMRGVEVYSAGIKPGKKVNEEAVKTMARSATT